MVQTRMLKKVWLHCHLQYLI